MVFAFSYERRDAQIPLTLTLSRRERGLCRLGKGYAKVSSGRG